MIDVQDLVKKYGSFTAVDHLSFQVERGELFGLLGPNGAGKTTTISVLSTLLPANGGQVRGGGLRRGPRSRRACAAASAWCPRRSPSTRTSAPATTSSSGAALRPVRQGSAAPDGGDARGRGAERARPAAGVVLLRGHEATAEPGRRPHARARRAVPGRAHRGHRRPGPQQDPRPHPPPQRRRPDRALHHALPRGGRAALRPHRRHRPRPAGRPGRQGGPHPPDRRRGHHPLRVARRAASTRSGRRRAPGPAPARSPSAAAWPS